MPNLADGTAGGGPKRGNQETTRIFRPEVHGTAEA